MKKSLKLMFLGHLCRLPAYLIATLAVVALAALAVLFAVFIYTEFLWAVILIGGLAGCGLAFVGIIWLAERGEDLLWRARDTKWKEDP